MSNSNLQQLGATLRAAREKRGLTVRTLAEVAKLSPSMVTRLEMGKISNPHATQLAPLFHTLGVDIEELYIAIGLSSPETLPALPMYLRAKHDMKPSQIARFEKLLHEVEGEDRNNSPEGTRRHGDVT